MLNIKQGQAEISEYIKSDISDTKVRQALNSGKRLRSLACLGCAAEPAPQIQLAVAVEYIHNGILLLEDMEINREMRRGSETIHRKYGLAVASKISAHLISKGLAMISLANKRATEVGERVSAMCLEPMLDLDSPVRVINQRLRTWHGAGGMFAIPFIVAAGPNGAIIGECLGVCYYLCMQVHAHAHPHPLTNNDRIDLFTENMREAVTEITKQRLWNPLLKEIVNFIMSRFKGQI